jgi:hypothetical protein
VAAGAVAHTGFGGIQCGSVYRGLPCGPTANGQPHGIRRLGCGSARCRPRCGQHRVGRAHGIQGILCGLGGVRTDVCRKTPLCFGMACQVLDAGPARGRRRGYTSLEMEGVGGRATRSTASRGCPKGLSLGGVRTDVRRKTPLCFGMACQVLDAGPARGRRRGYTSLEMEGVGGRATRSTASRGCPKGSVWRRKGRALAPILGSATKLKSGPVLGSSARSSARPGGVAMAGEAACERKRKRAHTPNHPGANGTGRAAPLTTKPQLADGMPASVVGTARNGEK